MGTSAKVEGSEQAKKKHIRMSTYSMLSKTFFSTSLHTFQSVARHMASNLMTRNFSKEEQAVLSSFVRHEGDYIFLNHLYLSHEWQHLCINVFLLTGSKLLWGTLENGATLKLLCSHVLLAPRSLFEN